MKKFIKCFSEEKYNQLLQVGYKFSHVKNGVYWFEDNCKLTVNFSSSDILQDTKVTTTINF